MSEAPVDAIARARAAALAELRAAPVATPWPAQAARLSGTFVLTGLVAVAVTIGASLSDWARVLERTWFIVGLLAIGTLGGVATMAPRLRATRVFVIGVTPLFMAALALSRGVGLASSTPAWVCSASHLALGLIPLGVALAALRQCAWSWSRSLVAGVGAGTAGALLGELACRQGAQHVLIYHLGAWIVLLLACTFISRRLRPRAFSP